MKRIFSCFIFLCVLLCSVPIYAENDYGDLTPAIQIIRNKTKLHKHGAAASGVVFSQEEFQKVLGEGSSHLTVLSLPEYGKLLLKGLEVSSGQSISIEEVGQLTYVPIQKEPLQTSFVFKCANRTNADSLECVISLNDSTDISLPEEINVSTYRDVMTSIPLKQQENVQKESKVLISVAPSKGVISLSEDGSVHYRPQTGFEGKDSFRYRILDTCGKISDEMQVNIKVEKAYRDVFFADLRDSPYHRAAIDFIKYTDFEVAKNEQGYYLFEADSKIPLTQVEAMINGILEREQYYQEVFEGDEDNSLTEILLEELGADEAGETSRLEAALAISKALTQTKEAEQGLLERIMRLFG